MVLPKKKNYGNLGRAMIKSRFQGQHGFDVDEGKLTTTDSQGTGDSWMKMRSITQENDLEAFLSTAELADTDFTAERINVKVVQDTYRNPFLLSDKEEMERIEKQKANIEKLSVPRRPHWEKTMTAEQVQKNEQEGFLSWRREMAQLEEEEGLLLTPYEKNLEVWRQLWRVIERSNLVVQIVDARNPLLFHCGDLDKYVKEVDPKKKNLLLINKADFLTKSQRLQWADYFDSRNMRYTFFSAMKANTALQQSVVEPLTYTNDKHTPVDTLIQEDDYQEKDEDSRIRISTTTDLLELLTMETSVLKDGDGDQKIVVGLVGYPNVGKSSTINALIGEKRVSVSSTPGKTKNFQTIHLSPSLVLCDCPGLVFPTFSTTKADQVCNGILSIDQLREHTGPISLVASRIPQAVLETTYGIKIETVPGSNVPTSAELCSSYANARGFFRSTHGNPDESRASRYILKDYVNGKLLFCHPPPGTNEKIFNSRINHASQSQPSLPIDTLNYLARIGGSSTDLMTTTQLDTDTTGADKDNKGNRM